MEVFNMAITLWKPRSLSRFGWDFGDWIDDFFRMDDWSTSYGYYPSMESFIKDNTVHLRVELPGVDPKDVDISLKDGHLCISGERKRSKTEKGSCYCFEEMNYGKFSRCFHVPRDVDVEKISAKYEKGMLELTIPLSEEVKGKKIPIEGVKEEYKKAA
jgi:Molecular chaperone (small heat shock protein)